MGFRVKPADLDEVCNCKKYKIEALLYGIQLQMLGYQENNERRTRMNENKRPPKQVSPKNYSPQRQKAPVKKPVAGRRAGAPTGKGRSGSSPASVSKTPAEKDKIIAELTLAVELLQTKVGKQEKLIKLKQVKIKCLEDKCHDLSCEY